MNNPARIASQAEHCAKAVANVLVETLIKRKPADRSLSSLYFQHREFGSRDRRLISETLFSTLRWWGWLKNLAPKKFLEAMEKQSENPDLDFPLSQFFLIFSLAWYLEGKNELPPAANVWFEVAGGKRDDIKFLPQDAQTLLRKRYLKPYVNAQLNDLDLIPSWTLNHVNLDKQDQDALLETLQRRPPVWLRLQPDDQEKVIQELKKNDCKAELHPTLENAVRLDFVGGNLKALDSFKKGLFEIQDIASQCVAYICNPKPGQQWWDACAGGGGKTLHLATLMQNKGSVLASDIRTHKLQELKLRARRAQFPNIRYKEWKGKDMPTFKNLFDGVLVDTPCSCSGTWRRNPDLRWTMPENEIPDYAALQAQLLANAANTVKPNGTLVYSTCSMFVDENINIVNDFLQTNQSFELQPFTCPLTQKSTDGTNQIWYWDADCDAMFTAKFVRVN